MAYITPGDVNAWLESTKLSLSSLDSNLEPQISARIISRLAPAFDVSSWADNTNTPVLVRSIIAMHYASSIYDRAYADENAEGSSNYAFILRRLADANISGLLAGTIILSEDPDAVQQDQPAFFPNDASSTVWVAGGVECGPLQPGDGPASFSMGQVF